MVPVLAAVPIETAIWIILVVIGVISSIVSNARKAVKAARPQGRLRVAAPGVVAQAMAPAVIEPVEPPAPVIIRTTPKRAAPAGAAAVAVPKAPEASGTQPFRGMFERGNLVRAIVAAEVLGPPKALQEQSIWSPRHSEPSI